MTVPTLIGTVESSGGNNSTSRSVSFTVQDEPDSVLLACVDTADTNEGDEVTDVVLDPGGGDEQSFTLVHEHHVDQSTHNRAKIFILVNPPVGTFTIEAQATASVNRFFFSVQQRSGVDQSTPTGETSQEDGSSATPTPSLTTTGVDSLVLATWLHEHGTNFSPGTDVTEHHDLLSSGYVGWAGSKDAASIDSYTVDATCGGADNYVAVIVEINSTGGAATPFSDSQPAYAESVAEVSLYGKWYEHYHKWDGWTGSAFDVVAEVTFTHATADSITTEMFYKGNNNFAWRFVGTAEGEWSWSTSSSHAALDGHSGTITVNPQSSANHRGYVLSSGTERRWTRSDGTVFVPQLVSIMGANGFNSDYGQIDTWIDEFLGPNSNHYFNAFHSILRGYLWQENERRTSTVSADAEPYLPNFEAYEELIWRTYDAGGFVQFFMYGETAQNDASADLPDGANGLEDERMQRYIAARWGLVPGWTLSYGIDLSEWATDAMLTTWSSNLGSWWGHSHLHGGRGNTNVYTRVSAAGNMTSWEWHEPDYQDYLDHISNADASEPVISEDRFRATEDGSGKNYTEEQTRRGLYHSFFAGGVANSWANTWDGTDEHYDDVTNWVQASEPYFNPEWIKNYSLFVEGRFSATATPDNSLTNTDAYALEDDDEGRRLFYREDAGSVDIDLTGAGTITKAVAVDTTAASYTETDISGDLTTDQDNTWTAPSTTDWAIYVEFETASDVTINASVGVIAVTGPSATIEPGEATVSAVAGTVNITGPSAAIEVGEATIGATAGTVSISGQTATIETETTILGNVRTITVSGQQATVETQTTISAGAGAILISGQQAEVVTSTTIEAITGVISVSGQAATVSVAGEQTISASAASIQVAGQSATISPGEATLSANAGVITIAGQSATVETGEATLSASVGTISITGPQASIEPGATTVAADSAIVQVSGQSATITNITGELVEATVGTIQVSGLSATVSPGDVSLLSSTGVIVVEGQQATISTETTLSATVGVIAIDSPSASVATEGAPQTIDAVTGLVEVAGPSAAIVPGEITISSVAGVVVVSGPQANVLTGNWVNDTQPHFRGMKRGLFKRMGRMCS